MQHYFSDNNLFRIDVHEDGRITLHRFDSAELFMMDNAQVFELFSLMCLFITDHIIPDGFKWLVSDYRESQLVDPPYPYTEDDIPF